MNVSVRKRIGTLTVKYLHFQKFSTLVFSVYMLPLLRILNGDPERKPIMFIYLMQKKYIVSAEIVQPKNRHKSATM